MRKRNKERSIADDMRDYQTYLKAKELDSDIEIYKHLLIQIIRTEVKAELYRISARHKIRQQKRKHTK